MAISLKKGQGISLSKEAPGMKVAMLGAGWGMKLKKGFFGGTKQTDVDLDASCLVFDDGGRLIDQVWFQQLRSKDGMIQHTGDDLSGGGSANDPNEEILVDLERLTPLAKTLVFTINSFSGESFAGIPNAFCILKNVDNSTEVARYNLTNEGGNWTALVIAKLVKGSRGWEFHAIGTWANGQTFQDIMPEVQRSL
jgi:tellurium resistance protein TerZ